MGTTFISHSGLDSSGVDQALRPVELPPLETTPLVSVLVSSYNYADFIDECIESILRQSWQRFELIVSDDGSTDRSTELVERWVEADSRVRLIRGPNRGMAGALNAAWKASRGQVICLLDADDTFLPDKLQCVVRAFQAHQQVGFVINRTCRTDANGQRQGVSPLLQSGPSGWCAEEALENGGVLPDIPPTSNLSFRREIGENIFPLPPEFLGYAVVMFTRLAPLFTEILSLDQGLATWRLHGNNDSNASHISDQQLEREIDVFENIWHLQRRYLESAAPDTAARLQPVTNSEYYCRIRYALGRRHSSSNCAALHRQLLTSPGFRKRPVLDRIFWNLAPWLPASLVSRIFDMTMTQNRAKEWIARILRIGA